MNNNGEKLVDALCQRLKDMGKTCHDYQIVALLLTLDRYELNQLITFGTVDKWVREKNNIVKNLNHDI